ncbi:uncharacterized protein BKCO1_180006 [Diplodia corticola]|uniref:Uncharacterized protein n=1 Tax=Diplodia corticola TaxID=236234 RepID=A0A1J9S423_9PEZI|nr:uncharacterized protein BKCO1_180006 [Diplodia corticola]OJD35287.1 hypothetical protein BKCO1_180006 [Diplodia corticola]
MSAKTQDPSRNGVAAGDSVQHQPCISFKALLVGLCALFASFLFLANAKVFHHPKSQVDLILEEIASSVTRADLKEATDAVNGVLGQLIVELRAHSSRPVRHPLREPTKDLEPAKRQLFPDLLGGLFDGDDKESGGGGNAAGGAATDTNDDGGGLSSILSGLLGGGDGGSDDAFSTLAKPLANAIGNLVSEGVSGQGPLGGILGGITDALGSGANALGAGVGEGAIKGLNLGNMTTIRTTSKASGSGISGIAKNLGEGVSEAIFSSIDISKLTPSSESLALAASALGSGLGNGSASGLKLSQNVSGPDSTHTGLTGLAGNLGFGLTDGLFGNIDAASLLNGQTSQGFMRTLAQIPGPAGRGLGQGAAIGLKLANASSASTDTTNDTFNASTASESFTRELASGFLANINIQQVNQEQILATVAQVAPAIGRGLGRGAAVGLNGQSSASTTSASPPPTSSTVPTNGPGDKRQVDSAPAASGSLDLEGIAGNFSQNLAQSFVGNVDVSQIGGAEAQKQLLNTLSQAAPFAGSGLGQGAAEGLGLTGKLPSESADSKRVATRQASGQRDDDASVGDIAQGFTRSLSSSFFSNANFSSLLSNAAGQDSTMIGSAVQGLAQGLGGGAATGLGLQEDVQEPIDGQDIGSVLKGFSHSLTTSFLANGTLDNIQAKAADAASIPVVPAVQGLAKGFGSGAASAFGLKEAAVLDPSATDIPTVAQGFSESLTQSFLSNGTAQKLSDMLGSQGSVMLGSIAEGLGKGFGSGAAESLGLQSDESSSDSSDSSDSEDEEDSENLDAPTIAQRFSKALTTSFLADDTLDKITQKAMSSGGGLTGNIDFSRVAEGLGIGLIDGGSIAIFMQTGMDSASLTENSQQFNDTVGGAATGFGRGVSSEAIKAVFSAFGNKDTADKLADELDTSTDLINTPDDSSSSAASATNKRSVAVAPKTAKRQAQLDVTDAVNAIAQNINVTTLNSLIQQGADALGCTGVGGLIQVGLGLQQNLLNGQTPKIPSPQNIPFLSQIDQTINITSDNDLFLLQLDLPTLSLSVNRLSIVKFAALLGAHVLAVALAFYLLLPAALALDAARTVAVGILARPDKLRFAPGTVAALQGFVVPALAAAGAGLGAVAAGSAAHARTPHQILGWVTLGVAVVGGALHVVAGRVAKKNEKKKEKSVDATKRQKALRRASEAVAQLVLGLAQVELVLGVQDLNEISFCATQGVPLPLAVAAGGVLTAVVFVSVGAVGLRVVVGRWQRERDRSGGGGGGGGGGEEKGTPSPPPPLVSRFSA